MRILIGMSNGTVESDLRSLLDELDGTEVVGVAQSSSMVLDYASRIDPDVVILHEHLGPEPVAQTIRDLGTRFPSVAVLQISGERTDATVIRAMEAGARGVIGHPFAFDDLSAKITQAGDWARHMKNILAGAIAQASSARGKVLAFVGAKGGVGTTTLALHVAIDHLTANPDRRVCVVDLDLEKGDVSAVLEVRQAVSIADLAKVHQDLSSTTVNDAIVQHECGLNLLLSPADVRHTEIITAEALRPIFALLRREFDLIVVDGGGSVSPSQATVLELADEAVVVTTADVLAVRAMRKRVLAWEALGVTDERALRVLVNKVDKTSIFPASAVEQLTTASVLESTVPLSVRALEPAMNERDPRAVTEVAWWKLMTAVRRDLDLETAAVEKTPKGGRMRGTRATTPTEPTPADEAAAVATAQATADAADEASDGAGPDAEPASRPAGRRRIRERGQLSLENVVMLPFALLIALAAWQVVVIGLTFVMSGNAAAAAAREYSVSGNRSAAEAEARRSTPMGFDDLGVSVSGNDVTVRMRIPMAGPRNIGFPQELSSTRGMVSER
ncbi:AAA family ATPase [Phycicoccus sp. BSK3Z-2]|uniref:AAA family ATPase n=1 Tax=Phycicoccus avicenniae TaxID=2828860 RepID=A0A941DA27_9MICO|nr:AAA family ATPase [Phycicoccus avicenniae]MBR7742632.1 AAA family ATPase [Phycicoccus avicenniae]